MPTNENLRNGLLLLFKLKKSCAECHRLLVEAYGEHALSKSACEKWFRRFNNGDFDLNNKDRGRPPKKLEDAELQ